MPRAESRGPLDIWSANIGVGRSFSVAATLGSCLSLETEAKLRFPYIDIGGIYPNTLSIDDIRDIIALARSRPDIKQPVDQITSERTREAHVSSGKARENGDINTTFDVRKENGRWKIIASPNPDPLRNDLLGVAAVSAGDVWAVGFSGQEKRVLVEHWNGTAWSVR